MILGKYTWQILVMVIIMDGRNRAQGAPSESTNSETGKKIITWKNLVIKNSNNQQDIAAAGDDEFDYISNEANDILCTYALYAKTHFRLIYSIVTSGFYSEDTRKIISNLHLSYLNVFFKQLATFYNGKYDEIYQIPDWMKVLRDGNLLNNELPTEIKLRRELSDILLILKNFISNYGCGSYKLQSIITYLGGENNSLQITLIELLVKDPQFANLYNEVIDFKKEKNISMWLSKKNLTRDIKTSYTFSEEEHRFDNSSSSESTVEPPDAVRICGRYLFYYLKYIALDLYSNIVEINYLLKENAHKLRYSNYKSLAIIRSDTVNQKTLNDYASIIPATFSERYKLTNDNSAYTAEILNAKRLEINVRTLLNIELLKPIDKVNMIQLISENNNDFGFYDKHYYRYQTAKLEKIMNAIMTELHCTYTFFARTHFRKILTYLFDSFSNDKNYKLYHQDNLILIQKYYKISLQTLANFFHFQYRVPNWMIMVVVYFERFFQLAKNLNNFIDETFNVLLILNSHNIECNNPRHYSNTMWESTYLDFGKEIIKGMSDEYVNNKLDDSLNTMFRNMKLIMYLLEINKPYLPYYNFNQFDPIHWIFGFDNLNETAIKVLTINYFGENQDNSLYLYQKLHESKSEFNIFGRIKNAVILHDTVVNLMQTRMVQYVTHFVTHCKYLFFLIRRNYLNSIIIDQREYEEMCSGFPSYLMQMDVNEYNVFNDTIKENSNVILNKYITQLTEEQAQTVMFNKSYRLLMRKQKQIVVNSFIGDCQNPNFVTYLNVIKRSNVNPVVISTFINKIKLQINGLKTNIRRYFVSLMKTIRFYNFNTYNLIFNSIGNTRPSADYHD